MWMKNASMEKSAGVRKWYTSLAVQKVCLLDDSPRLCGTVLQFVLERYGMPKRFDECRSPVTEVMHRQPT